ncbi:cell wall-associated NlpC family hydrolase [Ruminiclostridium sufflavum DSM 19573]|uniref:Cell wall-associated NlpC family hydrolase n=1 Tax=Ruminiclostridium sufflavum DSM 19573 TaxID=1121337 RepID=A0A318XPP4_9FIRM|nr:NlpC/P60 family protein [Ruminiclostridium sufflavum]PYG89025.1 cell wall-associated NlpC family hydrolase [Ruminiclostridium sufflavum DSM 19573]
MKKRTLMIKNICIFLVIIITALCGCGKREIPITSNEQLLSGITPESAAVITEAVVDVFDKPDILSTRITQVLYNQVVSVSKEEDSWTGIKLLDGTSGWVKSKYISRDTDSVTDGSIKNKIVVTAKLADIYSGANNNAKYKKIVLGTELYSFATSKTGYDILLPENKKGWIDEGGVIAIPISDNVIPKTTNAEFVQTIKKFNGTIFVLGGTSGWGLDSAGLVYICSKINGVDLPRSAADMKKMGTAVKEEETEVGDLIFFSSDSLKKDVNDVGVYIGDNEFTHSSTSKGVVTDSLEDNYFRGRICGIRRIF